MTLSDFYQKYSSEEDCKLKFKQIRDQVGVVCKKCGCKDHYWQKTLWQYECKECRFRTTLRSGTILESSKLPFRYWLTAMAYLTTTKKSISALQLQKELGHKRYEPIWAMLHKLRLSMRYRDSQYKLTECIELDEGFFEQSDSNSENEESENQKRGRGSEQKAKVLVAAESKPVEKTKKNRHKPDKSVGYIKMTVMDELDSKSINFAAQKMISSDSEVLTDGYKGYSKLKEIIKTHNVEIIYDKKELSKAFPWVHIAISNAKRLLLGIHHSINSNYLQNYLDEFCYKFNRRYIDNLFDRLLIATVSTTWYSNSYESG